MIRLACEMSDSSKCLPSLIVIFFSFFWKLKLTGINYKEFGIKQHEFCDTITELLLCDAGHVINVNLIFSRLTLRQ